MIESSKAYIYANPEDVVHAMNFLNIRGDETKLYWLARCFISLDLPNFWIESFDGIAEDELFINQLTNFSINLHPAYVFVSNLITKARGLEERATYESFVEKNSFKH